MKDVQTELRWRWVGDQHEGVDWRVSHKDSCWVLRRETEKTIPRSIAGFSCHRSNWHEEQPQQNHLKFPWHIYLVDPPELKWIDPNPFLWGVHEVRGRFLSALWCYQSNPMTFGKSRREEFCELGLAKAEIKVVPKVGDVSCVQDRCCTKAAETQCGHFLKYFESICGPRGSETRTKQCWARSNLSK